MADFNDFLNTKSDPMQTSNLSGTTQSDLQQLIGQNKKPETPAFDNLKQDIEKQEKQEVQEKELTEQQPKVNKTERGVLFGTDAKVLKVEDINKVMPDYDDVRANTQAGTFDAITAEARQEYDAHLKQIEQDSKYYLTGRGGKYVSKIGDRYSNAYLENEEKPNEFSWDKYALMSHFGRPIYEYGKESTVLSFIKGAAGFFTNMLSAVGRVTALPADMKEGSLVYGKMQGDSLRAQLTRTIYGVNDDDTRYDMINKTIGEELANTTKTFRDINQSLDAALGIDITEKTNQTAYSIGQAFSNVAIMFGTMGIGTLANTVKSLSVIRNIAGNLTAGMYAASAFQSYALDALNAGKDPLKAHAAASVNAILNFFIERLQWKIINDRIGRGLYRSANDMIKAYKTVGPDAFYRSIYKDSVAASMLSEGFEEGIQQSIEHGLKLYQGINENDAVAITADIAQSMLLGAVLSLPFAHIASNAQFKVRDNIASKFVNLNEEDARALAMIFVAQGENLAKDKKFQKEFILMLRDNILNLKPADRGQDIDPTSDSGIVQELAGSNKLTLGNDNFDTMLKNGNNLKQSLFDLMINPKRKQELDDTMMQVSKLVKNYAVKYMGQSEEEANLTAQMVQSNIMAIAITTDMSAKQILNAVMPKIHNRSIVSALNNYQSSGKGALKILDKYKYKNNKSTKALKRNAESLKMMLSQPSDLEKLVRLNAEGKTLDIEPHQRNMMELRAIIQRETAIQQQIRKKSGVPIDYNTALDIAIYKLLGANERTISNMVGSEYSFFNDTRYNELRYKYLLSSIDTTNDDFLGVKTYNATMIQTTKAESGTDAAAKEMIDREMGYKVAEVYSNRARNIISQIKKDKTYKLSKQDSEVLSQALAYADKQNTDEDIYGFHVTDGQINPTILLDRLATKEITVHEFAHHLVNSIVALNNFMAQHTGYHFVYFNNIINGIEHTVHAVYGKKVKIVDRKGNLNQQASELFANIIEDYVSGELKLDDTKFTDLDRATLNSVLDSYNNSISSSNASYVPATQETIKTEEQKQSADTLAANTILKRSSFSDLSLSSQLMEVLQDVLKKDNMSIKDVFVNLNAILNIGIQNDLFKYPAEHFMQLTVLQEQLKKSDNNSPIPQDSIADLYILITNIYTDLAKTSLESIITEEGPETNVKTTKGALGGGKGRTQSVVVPQDVRRRAEQIITKTVNKNNKKLLESDKRITEVSELSKQLFGTNAVQNSKQLKQVKKTIMQQIQNDVKTSESLVKFAGLNIEEAMLYDELQEDLDDGRISQEEYDKRKEEIGEQFVKPIVKEHLKIFATVEKATNKIGAISNASDKYYVAKEITLQLQKDFIEKNKAAFADKFYAKYYPSITELQKNAEERERVEKERKERKAYLQKIFKISDKKLGQYYKFTPEQINMMYDIYEEEEGANTNDVLNATIDIGLQIRDIGREQQKEKGKSDLKVDFKRSQNENYAAAEEAIANMKDKSSGKKGSEIMTKTEREMAAQDAVNEMYKNKDRYKKGNADIIVPLSVRLQDKVFEYNRRLEKFTSVNLLQKLGKGWELVKDLVVPDSARLKHLEKIDGGKNVLSGLRKALYDGIRKRLEYTNIANAFLEKIQGFSKKNPDDFMHFYACLLTDSKQMREEALKYAQKEGFEKELMDVFAMLQECKELRIKWKEFATGLDYYFPRHLIDARGLLLEIYKDDDTEFAKALRKDYKSAEDLYKAVYSEDEALALYKKIAMQNMKNSKKRIIEVMKDKYIKYYANIGDTLQIYIREQSDLVTKDSFLGKAHKMTSKIMLKMHEEFMDNPLNTSGGWYDILKQLGYLNPKNNYNNRDNKIIAKILDGIFFRARASRSVALYKDVTSAMLICNPIAALENLKDLGNMAMQYGLKRTLKSFAETNKESKDKMFSDEVVEEMNVLEEIKNKTIDTEYREITQSGLSNWIEKARKISGYTYLDNLNKVTFIRTMYNNYHDILSNKKHPKYNETVREIYEIFNYNIEAATNCIEQLKKDMKDVKGSEEINFFIWYKMCDNYALSAVEMPHWYNITTYGRVFYTFKIQPLKVATRIISDHMTRLEKANNREERVKAWTDLLKACIVYSMLGIPVDFIKDILDGVPQDTLPEYAVYTLLSNFMLSEYTIDKMYKDGPIKGAMISLLPPEGFSRLLSKEGARSIPVFGRPLQGAWNTFVD